MRTTLKLVLTLTLLVLIECVLGSRLPTTWTRSAASLSTANAAKYVAYDASFDSNLIFVFGGIDSPKNELYVYSIANDSFDFFDTLQYGKNPAGRPGAVMVGETIYYASKDGLFTYNVNTKVDTRQNTMDTQCITRHPTSNEKLYLIRGGVNDYVNSDRFYVFDIDSGSLDEGPSLSNLRIEPSCIVNDYNDDQTAYLYILLGEQYHVERINVDSATLLTDSFQTVGGVFSNIAGASRSVWDETDRLAPIASSRNLLYMFTANNDQNTKENQVFYYDITTEQFGYVGDYPDDLLWVGGVMAQNRIYAFGGTNGARSNAIYWSNEISFETTEPSVIPSFMPSGQPLIAPSIQPSAIPTTGPSWTPSSTPSWMPSSIPSSIPSSMPSLTPTSTPSVVPSVEPTAPGQLAVSSTNVTDAVAGDGQPVDNKEARNTGDNTALIVVSVACGLLFFIAVASVMMQIRKRHQAETEQNLSTDERGQPDSMPKFSGSNSIELLEDAISSANINLKASVKNSNVNKDIPDIPDIRSQEGVRGEHVDEELFAEGLEGETGTGNTAVSVVTVSNKDAVSENMDVEDKPIDMDNNVTNM